MSFSEKMEQIDKIVKRLETEQIPLEEALVLFHEGVGLIRECQSFLKDTEQEIMILDENGEEIPFNERYPKEGR